ncbi:MAG: P1 family peptidase [Candidatus Nanopelagicales bacterium]
MTTTGALRTRARDIGIPFDGQPGSMNSITDVPGVSVGYTTLIEGHGSHAVRTGVTIILPRDRTRFGVPVAAGIYTMNGNGEMTGSHWIDETGLLTLPIGITNSHAVGTVHRGIIDYVVANHPDVAADWLMPVVAETYDGDLNDINGNHVSGRHVALAIENSTAGLLAEGNVGGGTGMMCYEFKGGSGTASRTVSFGDVEFSLGAFVQANFGARDELTIAGKRLGLSLNARRPDRHATSRPPGGGSVIVVVGTDAPLLPAQCKALARRVPLGLARTGTTGSHFSGDIFLAFSTAKQPSLHVGYDKRPDMGILDQVSFVPWAHLDGLFAATVQAVEEAVVNAMCAAEGMTGKDGYHVPALPLDQVAARFSATA